MRRLLVLFLAFALTGCSGLAPVLSSTSTAAPTASPRIEIQTVVVTVLVTHVVTQTPSSTPTATLTPIPTFTPENTTLTAAAGTGTTTPSSTAATSTTPLASLAVTGTSATATLPADAGGGLFTNLTRSTDHFALNCQPDTVTFGVSTTNPDVTEVDLFYRMEDQLSSSISGWIDIGKMTSDQSGNFTMNFTASMVDRDLRSHKAWLDYQFVGLSKVGQVLGRSARIVKQVTFTLDCSG